MFSQTLDSALFLDRGYVNFPGSGAQVDVWVWHDYSYVLLWGAYVGLITLDTEPWHRGRSSARRVIAMLTGFVLLTAGLWLAQDAMNASLVMGRTYVDLPFYASRLDLYQARDLVVLLVCGGYLAFYALARAGAAEGRKNTSSNHPL
jgi:hypothetical protein